MFGRGKNRSNLALYFFLGLTLVLCLHLFFRPISRDGEIFLYVADLFFKGKIPYLEIWDNKPVGVYFILGLILQVSSSDLWIRSCEVILHLIATYTFFNISTFFHSKDFGRYLSTTLFAFWFSSQTLLEGGILCEEIGLPFMLLSLLFSLRFIYERKTAQNLVLCSFFATFSCFIKEPFLFSALTIVLFTAYNCFKARKISMLKWIVFGALGVLIPVLCYFIVTDSLTSWIDTLTWNLSRPYNPSNDSAIIHYLNVFSKTLWLKIILFSSIIILAIKRMWLLGALLIAGFVSVSLGTNYFSHYYIFAIPSLALVYPLSTVLIYEKIPVKKPLITFLFSVSIFKVFFSSSYLRDYWRPPLFPIELVGTDKKKTQAVIDQYSITRIWSIDDPSLYRKLGQSYPLKYFYYRPYMLNNEVRETLTRELKLNPPELILFEGGVERLKQLGIKQEFLSNYQEVEKGILLRKIKENL